GELWSNGTITVADEHYATEVVLEAIDVLSSKLKVFRKQKIGSALVANFVEGEYHTIGLEMFAELLKSQGWDVELFSVPLNIASLFKHLENSRKRFELICCSVTMEFNIEDLKSILKILRTNIHTRDSIVVVGSQLFLHKGVTDQIIDEETKKPLADFLAKNFHDGIQFVQSITRQ
ncbi:MAG: cobalamin B12-binding domain-containing protein, partial [Thaumarchaeota archaeon]|nr:cobalamin B12-binding domain-containing protein [Nitrososphaerota archaeon]